MIGFVKGYVEGIEDGCILIDSGNIGYNVNVPSGLIDKIMIGEELKLYTYLSVREDAMQLYGLGSRDELKLFKQLITVNGIGPKVALGIISSLSVELLINAIITDDFKTITKAPGVGPKMAQKLILELKDKVSLLSIPLTEQLIPKAQEENNISQDAVMALIALGYGKNEATNAVKAVDNNMATEDIIRQALQKLL